MALTSEHTARIRNPDEFRANTFFARYMMSGVRAIFGKMKRTGKYTIQSYGFSTEKYSADEAKAWLKTHGIKVMYFSETADVPFEALPKLTEKQYQSAAIHGRF